MDSFVAIDVETANFEPSSICAIGACKVLDGVIADRRYTLVCPEPDYYQWQCTKVHGLTSQDTFDAPSFGTVWKEWQQWISGLPLVAHNAAFDSKCIREACRIYGLEPPSRWMCTLQESRRKIPRYVLPSKSLDSVCDFFGIPLLHHHNAAHDAEACAKIALTLIDFGEKN